MKKLTKQEKEHFKMVKVPISKLPFVMDLLINDTDPTILKELKKIEDFLHWAKHKKGIYLCEWFDGHNDMYAKIPKGFIAYAGGLKMLYEKYWKEK